MNKPYLSHRDQRGAVNIGVIAAVLIVLIIGGYLIFSRSDTPETSQSPSPLGTAAETTSPTPTSTTPKATVTSSPKGSISATTVPLPSPSPFSASGSTAGWFAYTNTKYKFDLKFHPAWEVAYFKNEFLLMPRGEGVTPTTPATANEIAVTGPSCKCAIFIEEAPTSTLDEWIALLGKTYTITNKKEITLNGIRAFQFIGELEGSRRREIRLVYANADRPGIVYRVAFLYDLPGQSTAPTPDFDLMVSTFKVLK